MEQENCAGRLAEDVTAAVAGSYLAVCPRSCVRDVPEIGCIWIKVSASA